MERGRRRTRPRQWFRFVKLEIEKLMVEHESGIGKVASWLSRNAYPSLDASGPSKSRPRALLMTSLPNIGHIPTRLAFHEALLGFCKSYNQDSCPLIVVHSDSGSSGKAEASWMDRDSGGSESILDVVGRKVFDGPWSAEIK